jgi:hypothetical protein
MTSRKLYSGLIFFISLTLSGCGNNHSATNVPEITTEEDTLSVANPITDITLVADATLDFSIPTDTCIDNSGVDINYQIEVTNNVGFTLVNDIQLSGSATEMGVVNVTVVCSTTTESLTDEFTITVIDFEVDPTVTAVAPSLAYVDDIVSLTATAKDNNLFGSIVSYSWVETSDLGITLTNSDMAVASFTAPDTVAQSKAIFSITVTDNDGATAKESVEIDLISTLAPTVSLSFPLAFGVYNQDSIDIFGNVEPLVGDGVENVVINVNGVEYAAIVSNKRWRIENIDLTDITEISMFTTSTNGFINYKEHILNNDTFYSSSIDNSVSDIAVNDETDEIYVQLNGGFINPIQFIQFNLTSAKNSTLIVNQADNYAYRTHTPTSIALDSESNTLFVSYPSAVSEIDLTTGYETVLSDSTNGTGTAPLYISDLSYDSGSQALYLTDLTNKTISSIDVDTGDRSELRNSITDILSINVNSTNGDFYYSQGRTTSSQTLLREYDNTAVSLATIYDISAGNEGGPISDIAINEDGEELFFVDGKGSLIKLDLADNSTTEVITDLFLMEDIIDETSSIIGLHYHAVRNVLIAVGKDIDGITNKLLIIDPKSGDYAKVATGE